jgi:glycosyltransferase involved in cell wall biosynthesis
LQAFDRAMRIAQVAPLFESVPPKLYGGTERVVSWLTEALVRRGHDVTLFAAADSRTAARLVASCPRAMRVDPASPDATALHVIQLGEVFARARDFDLIHCHVDYPAFPFGRLVETPVVHTLHGRLDVGWLERVFTAFPDTPLVSISAAQRVAVRHLDLNWIATVYHGLPVEHIPFRRESDGYLAFLGRISPEKRPDLAIEVAKRVGLPLKIAAKIDRPDRAYFEREIRPLLDDPLIEFVGEVADAAKYEFLGGALCLLFPIDWPEPFGLVMIESLACGTPVVGRPCGSVPEVVRGGETGFIADTVEELVAAVKRIDVIDRGRCREDVCARFSVERMTDDYERVYSASSARRSAARRRART